MLLDPDKVPGRQAVRTALMHLAALGHLLGAQVAQRRWGFTATTTRLRGTARDPAELPPHLRALLDALALPDDDGGLAPTEVVHRLQKAFGYDYGRYVASHLRGPLVERGLLRAQESRVLGVFRRVRHHPTAQGERLRADVQEGVRAAALLSPLGLAKEDERRERWMESLNLLAEIDWGVVLDALDGVADAFDAGDGGGADGGGGDGGGGGE